MTKKDPELAKVEEALARGRRPVPPPDDGKAIRVHRSIDGVLLVLSAFDEEWNLSLVEAREFANGLREAINTARPSGSTVAHEEKIDDNGGAIVRYFSLRQAEALLDSIRRGIVDLDGRLAEEERRESEDDR